MSSDGQHISFLGLNIKSIHGGSRSRDIHHATFRSQFSRSAWTTSCTSKQRDELASVQRPGPTEGAGRKEEKDRNRERKGGGERERITDERQNNVRSSRSSTLLDSIFIPVINSILVVHGSFIRGPTSRSLSLFLSCTRASYPLITLSHFLCLIRARTRTFIHLVSV